MQVFNLDQFEFPYKNITFPGQYSDEKILFVTREGKSMLWLRMAFITLIGLTLLTAGIVGTNVINRFVNIPSFIPFAIALIALIGSAIGYWWVYTLWRKSVFIVTTRRLTKFIYTTPFTRYQLSLGLDRIVDTGAYQKSYLQAFTNLGYFVARSAAGNIKNFKIINISFYEDLHNYINKLLFTFNKEKEQLNSFRPFIPHLKGEARKKYVKKVAPEYSKEKRHSDES
jgi:hypothetical protein